MHLRPAKPPYFTGDSGKGRKKRLGKEAAIFQLDRMHGSVARGRSRYPRQKHRGIENI